jgi:KDO2-lipid IV(A) lauroyltransferase
MSLKETQRPSFAPRHWPGWLGVALVWLLGSLPRRMTLMLTESLGPLMYRLAARRRKIAERNLERCFPKWDESRREAVVRENFRSVARMLAEMAWSWSGRDRRIDRLGEVHGFEHLERAMQAGRGVLVVTSHNTCLEIGARIAARQVWASGIYRPLGNEVMEWYQNRRRAHYCKSMLSKRELRAGIRLLRNGEVLWYAPDQDFGPEQSVFAPFFGIPAATLLATHRLPKMTGCAVVMMFAWYDRPHRRYHVEFLPQLEHFPTDDPVADLSRINAMIEERVRRHPEQYWWIHRRFKTRPEGEPPFYE